jgi:hypothetical protein
MQQIPEPELMVGAEQVRPMPPPVSTLGTGNSV